MPTTGQRPTYFITANFDFPPPPGGPVRLGQLIAAPENPGRPVDPAGPLPFSDFEGMEKHTNSTKFSVQRLDARETELGLFGRALQAVSISLGLTLSRVAVSYMLNEIDRLDVEFIEPTEEYARASMERPEAKAALKEHLLRRKRLYMVTGIKTAYPGAKLERKNASDTTLIAEAEARGPAELGTVGGGAQANFSGREMQNLSLGPSRPFVYGYRLRECYYSIRGLRTREYVDGALFGVGDETGSDSEADDGDDGYEEREEDIEFEFDGLDDEDLANWDGDVDGGGGGGGCKFKVVSLIDECGGAACDVIVPIADKP